MLNMETGENQTKDKEKKIFINSECAGEGKNGRKFKWREAAKLLTINEHKDNKEGNIETKDRTQKATKTTKLKQKQRKPKRE